MLNRVLGRNKFVIYMDELLEVLSAREQEGVNGFLSLNQRQNSGEFPYLHRVVYRGVTFICPTAKRISQFPMAV